MRCALPLHHPPPRRPPCRLLPRDSVVSAALPSGAIHRDASGSDAFKHTSRLFAPAREHLE